MATIACIGSRELSKHELNTCEKLGEWIVKCGHTIISGNAKGADQAYARGGNRVDPRLVHLMLPWEKSNREAIVPGNVVYSFNQFPKEYQEYLLTQAAQLHPAWERCNRAARQLHARNGLILVPPPKFQPDDLCLAFPGRLHLGGTGQGMRLSNHLCVPLVDLRDLGNPELATLCHQIQKLPVS